MKPYQVVQRLEQMEVAEVAQTYLIAYNWTGHIPKVLPPHFFFRKTLIDGAASQRYLFWNRNKTRHYRRFSVERSTGPSLMNFLVTPVLLCARSVEVTTSFIIFL